MKQCKKCGELKEAEDFGKHKSTKDKLDTWCKDCRRAYAKAYYERNKEKIIKRSRQWAKDNPDKHKENVRKWRKKQKKKKPSNSV